MTSGFYHSMQVAPKDVFGNPAIISQEFLTTEIRRVSCTHTIDLVSSFPELMILFTIETDLNSLKCNTVLLVLNTLL